MNVRVLIKIVGDIKNINSQHIPNNNNTKNLLHRIIMITYNIVIFASYPVEP